MHQNSFLPIGCIAAGHRLWHAFCPIYVASFATHHSAWFSYHARQGTACFTIQERCREGPGFSASLCKRMLQHRPVSVCSTKRKNVCQLHTGTRGPSLKP